jgi:DNA-directed RNA polymerase specialized sigma24 family protein
MSFQASDTHWLCLLKDGNDTAAKIIWDRYFQLLVGFARRRIGAAPRRAADEEDVALSAFASFCRGIEQGRFPRLDDSNDLRNVLLLLVARKAARQVRRERCAKRGGGKVSAAADLDDDTSDHEILAQMIDAEPTPDLAAQIADECSRLLSKLDDEGLQRIAIWQVEGFTVKEIAGKINRTARTVARKLTQIRDLWIEERPKS